MSEFYSNKNKISFKEIVLGHYKRILELSTSEFVKGYWTFVTSGNTTIKTYVSSKESEFKQAVECLALSLYPYFDEQMITAYDKFSETDDGDISKGDIKEISLLFRELSCLLHRLKYLATVDYEEYDDELDDEDDE